MPGIISTTIEKLFKGDLVDQRTAVAMEELKEFVVPLVETYGPVAAMSALLTAIYGVASGFGMQRAVASDLIDVAYRLHTDARSTESEERDGKKDRANPRAPEAG